MFPVRLSKLECTDRSKIDRFLTEARIGYLGLSDENRPYVVPLNFVWLEGAVYFHGAAEGRKVDVMGRNNQVCFTVSEELGTMTAPVPAHTDTAYMSAIVFGTAGLVADGDEARNAMQAMLDKYVPGYFDQPLAKSHLEKYRSSLGSRTAVFKLTPESVSAKENEPDPAKLFFPGKKPADDARRGDD